MPDVVDAVAVHDKIARIVAVERADEDGVRVYRRTGHGVIVERDTLAPWLVTTAALAQRLTVRPATIEPLRGEAPLNTRLRFATWSAWRSAWMELRESREPLAGFASPVEQYLVDSGRALFLDMTFEELVRAQIDIETTTLDPHAPEAALLVVAVAINGQDPVALRADELGEVGLLAQLNEWIQRHDPDVIEGHNVFNFDLPYLVERARSHGMALTWGRDGSAVRIGSEQRFKAGPRSIPYQAAWVYGRHLIDTWQQVQRYDTAGQLESYALKPVVAALGLERADRVIVAGGDVTQTWERDREQVVRYVVDDVLDVAALSHVTLQTEFYQTRLLPRGLQAVATGGTGEKINDLLLRAYIAAGESVPLPQAPSAYPGGFAEVRRTGRFAPVVKCDVESLYPSIMLADGISPASDRLGVFLPTLQALTEQRLTAKRTQRASSGPEATRWDALQSSYKVLINSFYGYLGYSRGFFNDYDAAERVTLRGQEIVQQVVEELERRGARTIEIDTDGVFFEPPSDVCSEEEEIDLIDQVSATLPRGIRLAHDGRYRGMLSLKLKNYALLGYDGRVMLKGSSLRSRREERVLRRFTRDVVSRLLEPERFGPARELYLQVAEQILSASLPPDDLARWESITPQTFSSEANRRLAAAVGQERIGERVQIYQRRDGSLARIEEWSDDEDRAYLLRRLRDMAERFRPVFDLPEEFDYTFPAVTPHTDLATLRQAPSTQQLSLFDQGV